MNTYMNTSTDGQEYGDNHRKSSYFDKKSNNDDKAFTNVKMNLHQNRNSGVNHGTTLFQINTKQISQNKTNKLAQSQNFAKESEEYAEQTNRSLQTKSEVLDAYLQS